MIAQVLNEFYILPKFVKYNLYLATNVNIGLQFLSSGLSFCEKNMQKIT